MVGFLLRKCAFYTNFSVTTPTFLISMYIPACLSHCSFSQQVSCAVYIKKMFPSPKQYTVPRRVHKKQVLPLNHAGNSTHTILQTSGNQRIALPDAPLVS